MIIDDPTSPPGDFSRLPPNDQDAERCFNASAILDPVVLDKFSGVVRKEMFYSVDNQIIFEILLELRRKGKPCDAVILRNELAKRGMLEEVGGVKYIAQMLDQVPSAAHAPHYAAIIIETYKRRRLIEIANGMLADAYQGSRGMLDADELVNKHAAEIASMIGDNQIASFRQLGDIELEVFESMNKPSQQVIIPTGIGPLDDAVGGVGQGEMVIVAAYPSVGKSTFLRTIMRRLGKAGIPVGLISVEESDRKVAANILSAESEIINNRIRKGELDDAEMERMYDGFVATANFPAYVATTSFDIDSIRAVAMRMKAMVGIKVVMVDYLQRIKGPGKTRFEIVTNLSLELSRMVKELKLGGIVTSQLNRDGLKRDDHRPRMGDLRESGQLDQDADMVLFLHREDAFHLSEPSYITTNKLEIIVAKSRDGERGHVITLTANLPYQRFDDPDPLIDFQ